MIVRRFSVVVLAATLAVGACKGDPPPPPGPVYDMSVISMLHTLVTRSRVGVCGSPTMPGYKKLIYRQEAASLAKVFLGMKCSTLVAQQLFI